MLYALVAALLLAVVPHAARAGETDARRAECAKVKEKIRHVRSEMRQGYTRAKGEKLEAELRRLREKRRRVCN